MKIIIIHGDNLDQSYKRINTFKKEARKRNWDIIYIDKNKNIKEQLQSTSLFNKEVLFIVDDINKFSKSDFRWLKEKNKHLSGTLTIYSDSLIKKSILNALPKIHKLEEYQLPFLVWKFLESLYPGNSRNCIKLLHEVIKKESPIFIYALLAKYFRDLYWSNVDKTNIPYPSWRINKLRTQARKYPKKQLKKIVRYLADKDIKIKTSSENNLETLDFLIATELE